MKDLRKWIRTLFTTLVRLAVTSPLTITDLEIQRGDANVPFWKWIPDIRFAAAKFMSFNETFSEGAADFLRQHQTEERMDVTTKDCNIFAIDFSSVKVLEHGIEWMTYDFPESVRMVILHEEEVDRGADSFRGAHPPKIFYPGSSGLQLWRD